MTEAFQRRAESGTARGRVSRAGSLSLLLLLLPPLLLLLLLMLLLLMLLLLMLPLCLLLPLCFFLPLCFLLPLCLLLPLCILLPLCLLLSLCLLLPPPAEPGTFRPGPRSPRKPPGRSPSRRSRSAWRSRESEERRRWLRGRRRRQRRRRRPFRRPFRSSHPASSLPWSRSRGGHTRRRRRLRASKTGRRGRRCRWTRGGGRRRGCGGGVADVGVESGGFGRLCSRPFFCSSSFLFLCRRVLTETCFWRRSVEGEEGVDVAGGRRGAPWRGARERRKKERKK